MIPARFARFDHLCAGLGWERPGPLLALQAVAAPWASALHDAVVDFLTASAPPGAPAGDEEGLLGAFVDRGASLPWMTGSGRVLPTRATARPYATMVRAAADILVASGASARLASIHLFSVKLKAGGEGGEQAAGLAEVLAPHLETWQGATVSTVAFHLPVLGDLERNFIQFYAATDAFDVDWLLRTPEARPSELARHHQPLRRAPRPGELVIFDAGTLHHTRQLPPCGPRVTLEIMATVPGPDTRVDHRPWDQALPVDRFLAIGRERVMIPAEPVGKTVRVGGWEPFEDR
jgi:hypothetical protein